MQFATSKCPDKRTELLLDDLKDLLLVKFLWETLNGGQRLTTITL